jgi:hypothetical protein
LFNLVVRAKSQIRPPESFCAVGLWGNGPPDLLGRLPQRLNIEEDPQSFLHQPGAFPQVHPAVRVLTVYQSIPSLIQLKYRDMQTQPPKLWCAELASFLGQQC